MTGVQSRSRLQHEISRTTQRQDGLSWRGAQSCRRARQFVPGAHADERDDLVNDAG